MQNVVFTGQAIDTHGNAILRAKLAAECNRFGLNVQSAIKPNTSILVASRDDTVKARTARAYGVQVMSYSAFVSAFLPGVDLAA